MDLSASDTIIVIGEEHEGPSKGGGRNFEMGFAFACGMLTIHVGPREHIFAHHPKVCHFDHWGDIILDLIQYVDEIRYKHIFGLRPNPLEGGQPQ